MAMTSDQRLMFMSRYLSMTRHDINRYIAPCSGTRASVNFKLLTTVYMYPKLTITALKSLMGSKSANLDKNTAHLLNIGLIKTLKKHLWVEAIHAYRVNTHYEITKKGLFVIIKILDELSQPIDYKREESGINHAIAS